MWRWPRFWLLPSRRRLPSSSCTCEQLPRPVGILKERRGRLTIWPSVGRQPTVVRWTGDALTLPSITRRSQGGPRSSRGAATAWRIHIPPWNARTPLVSRLAVLPRRKAAQRDRYQDHWDHRADLLQRWIYTVCTTPLGVEVPFPVVPLCAPLLQMQTPPPPLGVRREGPTAAVGSFCGRPSHPPASRRRRDAPLHSVACIRIVR